MQHCRKIPTSLLDVTYSPNYITLPKVSYHFKKKQKHYTQTVFMFTDAAEGSLGNPKTYAVVSIYLFPYQMHQRFIHTTCSACLRQNTTQCFYFMHKRYLIYHKPQIVGSSSLHSISYGTTQGKVDFHQPVITML